MAQNGNSVHEDLPSLSRSPELSRLALESAASEGGAAQGWGVMPHRTSSDRFRDRNPFIDKVETLPQYIVAYHDAPSLRGRWQKRFPREQPLTVDLGSGSGHYLIARAIAEPDRNFLGLELKYKRLFKTAEKALKAGLSHVQCVRYNAHHLEEIFAVGEISAFTINFPDPWPKDRHEERRLVSRGLISSLERLLPIGGTVRLKSDWEPYREQFLEAFEGSSFRLIDRIDNLDDWSREDENVATSYETRFRREGRTCFFYEFVLEPPAES